MPEYTGTVLTVAGIAAASLAGVYLIGCLLACALWTKLWRRYGDVTVAAFIAIAGLSLASWSGALVAFAYCYGQGVVFARAEPGPSLVVAPPDAPAGA